MRVRRPLILALLLLSAACRAPIPVGANLPAWPRIERSAWIDVHTTGGTGTRVFDPEHLAKRAPEAHPSLFFGEWDQCLFAFGLREELARTGAFRRVEAFQEQGTEEIQIRVTFTRSFHEDDHSYTLEASLEARGTSAPLIRQYRVLSSAGESWWGRMTTSAWQGKQRAHRRLMDQVLADLRAWVAGP